MKDRTNKFGINLSSLFGMAALIILLLSASNSYAQERTVSGQVSTLDGPLMGAAVVLKGTAIGVATDYEGKFVFPKTLNEDDVLVFSFLGYETYEQTIGPETSYIRPFLEDMAVVIVGAARTTASNTSKLE